MKLINHTFIRISLVFMTGIILGLKLALPLSWQLVIFFLSFSTFCSFYFHLQRKIFNNALFGLSVYLVILLLGILTATVHQPANRPGHYINQLDNARSGALARVKVLERLKPSPNHERYIGEVKELVLSDTTIKKLSGKILLNISGLSMKEKPLPEDELLAAFHPEEINLPLNPHAFNYRQYMKDQGILRQLNLNQQEIKYLGHEHGFLGNLALFRKHIITNLEKQAFTKEQMGIIQALLLGQRQEISRETYAEYAAAGAIHILAVSGLHIGILLFLLSWFSAPLKYLRYGKVIQSIFILLFLWGFAGLANFSAPVLRAVTMFSFLAIGMQINRPVSLMNSLFVSLFILLLINPYYILQAGFQLSYLAVFAIISLQPFIRKLYKPRFKVDKLAWDILSVSLAAQLGILPLSLYYFHQFPGLFFLTNLVILPFLGILLGYGILMIMLASFGVLPAMLAGLFASCINLLNGFVDFIARQKFFIIEEISFNTAQLLVSYLLLLSLIILIYHPRAKHLLLLLMVVIGLQISSLLAEVPQNTSEVIIFHKYRQSILGIRDGHEMLLYRRDKETLEKPDFLKEFKREEHLKELKTGNLQNVYITGTLRLMVVDSSAIYQVPELHPQVVLLCNSPKLNLDRLLKELQPEMLIADGSNYPSLVKRWKRTCQKQKVPFHSTGEKGSFRISTGL